jgi:hypothetical protein
MSSAWKRLSWLGAAWLGLAGCTAKDMNIHKPPPNPPEYVMPPDTEARFSKPPSYPERTLNQGIRKADDPLGPPGLRSPGGSPRMGAGGPGMGGRF